MTAATQTMKVLARRWHSLCLWGKARTEELLEDKTNTGALEELMKRWGHCQETGEVKGNTGKSNTNGDFSEELLADTEVYLTDLNWPPEAGEQKEQVFLWLYYNVLEIVLGGI